MDELDLVRLDRELGRATREWVRWRRRLARGVLSGEAPFALHSFISRRGYLEIRDLPVHDPLRAPMLRFLFRLLDDKANAPLIAEAARVRYVVEHPLDQPVRGRYSFADVLLRALGDAPRREEWARQLFELAPGVAEPVWRHWERRREIAERLAVSDPDDVELPASGVYEVADAWLRQTEDAAEEHVPGSFAELCEIGLGLEAARAFPAKLSPAIVSDWFREGRLLDSLSLDPGPLPRALGPASALRALARVGCAFVDASAPRHLPFCIGHDPYGLSRFTHGALFAGLGAWPAFTRRALGVSRPAARDLERILGRVLLLATRAQALRVLLRRPALESPRKLRDAFEEGSARAFGLPLPPRAAGAFARLSPDDPARFAGALLAASRQRALVEEYDEDWYRNPRATERLRSEAELAPAVATTREALDAGATDLARALTSRS